MTADPARAARLESLFQRALELPPAERAGFLDAQCPGDPGLAAEVTTLLRYAGGGGPDEELSTGAIYSQVMRLVAGDRIGAFTVQRALGAGATGDVYLATQDAPQRDVALKVLRAMDAATRARFEHEGAALARLNHENIARVFAVGEEHGHPYLALELVRGAPITAFADAHHLTIRARLELFVRVCDALEHIHQQGLIHRDLKPLNIVVQEASGGFVPKVIDFGIAKTVTESHGAGAGTVDGAILGTIEYASPEQLRDSRSVDTRSDLYSAGVVLFELLAGDRPFRLDAGGLGSFVTRVQNEEPPAPSAVLERSEGLLPASAAVRGTTPSRLLQVLRTDLDWIVARTLRRTPGERYASAGALRADLQRYLRGEPVHARPPSLAYRLRKTLVRRRGIVLAVAGLALAVAGGLVATTRQAAIANARLAELQSLTADLISSVNEIADIPGAIQAKRRLVAAAARSLELITEHRSSPALRGQLAEAYQRVGQLRADPYTASLGETPQGVSDLCRAVTLRRQLYDADLTPDNATRLMRASHALALIMQSGVPAPPDPDSLLIAAIALGEPIVAGDSSAIETMSALAMVYDLHAEYELVDGKWDSTLELLNRALALRLAMLRLRPQSDEMLRWVAESRGRLAYAAVDPRVSRREALAAYENEQRYFDDHPLSYHALLDMVFASRNLAYALQRNGSLDTALVFYRRAVELCTVMAHADSGDFRSLHQLANADSWLSMGFLAEGRLDSAEANARRGSAIATHSAARPGAPVWTLAALEYHRRIMGRLMAREGRFAAADSFYAGVCQPEPVGGPLDIVKQWRDWVERAQVRLAARDRAGADSCFARSERFLSNAEGPLLGQRGADVPRGDLALAYAHLAQVAGHDNARRLRLVEHALRLTGIEHDGRAILPLLENELACGLACETRLDEAAQHLRTALGSGPKGALGEAIRRNLQVVRIAATRGAGSPGIRVLDYDPKRDPYARLDREIFRVIPVWGEHPMPPASLLALADR